MNNLFTLPTNEGKNHCLDYPTWIQLLYSKSLSSPLKKKLFLELAHAAKKYFLIFEKQNCIKEFDFRCTVESY